MDSCREVLQPNDYLVMLASLRQWARDVWAVDRLSVRAEIMRFVDLVERNTPNDVSFKAPFELARSMLALGRPQLALDCIEILLVGRMGIWEGKPVGIYSSFGGRAIS
ncbi:hypothetical protein [Burkholderia sp. PU8-34]